MARVWTCRRCRTVNPRVKQRCPICGARRLASRPPAHRAVHNIPYEKWVERFGEQCGICGRPPGARRLHRDHPHRGSAEMRGLLCFQCNAALRPYMTADWMRRALAYLERTETP